MKPKDQVKPGDIIHINSMFGEPQYDGKEGIVRLVDDMGQIHGSWGGLALFQNDDWEIIGESNPEVLEFICRRFKNDCDWLTGNCYYFAVILKDRFPEGDIYYDTIAGHFVLQLNGINYDWSGVVSREGYHYYENWKKFENYDILQKERIVEDCIL